MSEVNQASTSTAAPRDPLRVMTPAGWLAVVVIAALFGYAFRVPLVWMYDRWVREDSYYSHGFFVPIVAAYFLYKDRLNLAALPRKGSWAGFCVMLLGLMIFIASGLTSVFFAGMFGMILMLWGLAGFLFGMPVLIRLWFPAFVLLFMVPPPLSMIADISLDMKLFVTKIALGVIGLTGIPAVNDGSTIYMGDSVVIIGNACSGLRSLISLIFLGLLFSRLSGLPPMRRVILFVLSVPIAIISNTMRVLALCMIAYFFGSPAIEGAVHDISGYFIFIIAFLLLYLSMRILEMGLRTRQSMAQGGDAKTIPAGGKQPEGVTHA